MAPRRWLLPLYAALLSAFAPQAHADAVTDWNRRTGDFITAASLDARPAHRVMALAHTAAFDAVDALARRGSPPRGSEAEAAIAAAHRTVLVSRMPSQRHVVDAVYSSVIQSLPPGAARQAGIAAGAHAGREALTRRPPWLVLDPTQLCATPSPRTAAAARGRGIPETEQVADLARFWSSPLPPTFHRLVRSVAETSGRDLNRNARLFAAVTQALDDAGVTNVACVQCLQAGVVAALLQAEFGNAPASPLVTTSPTAHGMARRWTHVDAFVQEVIDARVGAGGLPRPSAEADAALGRRIGDIAAQRFGGG